MQFAIDEADGLTNRQHGGESVGYLAFSAGGTLYDEGTATSTIGGDSSAEFEFTITPHDAHVNTSYFFRAYDVVRDAPVVSTSTYPSLSMEAGSLTFAVSGLQTGSTTEGITTDITTSATSVAYGAIM